MKCPQHYLTQMQEVILFYNGLDILTRQILDSRGSFPTKTAANAKKAIQEMAEYSQKWHNGTSKGRSTETSDGLIAIQAQLNNLGREIKKVNEKVYAAQVGCKQCKGPHYTKVRMTRLSMESSRKLRMLRMDDDSEHEADDDMGYDLSDVAFTEWLRSKFFNYKTMDHYTMKALWIYWIRGDDEVELTDEESSDNDDEVADVFRIDTNLFDFETPIAASKDLVLLRKIEENRLNHNLCDIIVDGDLQEEAAPAGEQYGPLAPKTAKQLTAKRNQERVKSILLLAIPNEYLLKFHNVPDAKSL
ncbi:hypothetical protein Tco_0663504 [Tanacetum coccineum]